MYKNALERCPDGEKGRKNIHTSANRNEVMNKTCKQAEIQLIATSTITLK